MIKPVLKVNGNKYSGFKTLHVEHSVEQLAGIFKVTLAPPVDGATIAATGDYFEISFTDTDRPAAAEVVLIEGWVDLVAVKYGEGERLLTIVGRDALGDLVDCAAGIGSTEFTGVNEWADSPIETIVAGLVAPFGPAGKPIEIHTEVDTGDPIKTFRVQIGESVSEAISRLCAQRALLAYSGGDGLYLDRAGTLRATDTIRQGVNVVRCQARASDVDRYRHNYVIGSGENSSLVTTEDYTQPFGVAWDRAVKRNRPHVAMSAGSGDSGAFEAQAKWEAATRAGRSRQVAHTVPGWTMSDGAIWPLNRLVTIVDPWIGMNRVEALISRVARTMDQHGRFETELTTAPPETYTLVEDAGEIKNGLDGVFDITAPAKPEEAPADLSNTTWEEFARGL
jgi:prophage tail gpP-like protein